MKTRIKPIFITIIFTVILWIFGCIISPRMFSVNYIIQQIYIASFLGIIACGTTLVILLGHIDLSIPWTLTTAAIVSSGLLEKGSAVAILAGLSIGLFSGLFNSIGIVLLRVPSMIWTLGVSYVLLGFSVYLTGGYQPKGKPIAFMRYLAVGRTFLGIPNAIIVWLVISIVVIIFLKKTKYGRYIYAIGLSEKASYLSGINTSLMTTLVFCIAGISNAFAGMMLAGYANQAYQAMGDKYPMQAIAAVVIGGTSILGGIGSYSGTIAGVILITLISSLLSIMQIPEGV